jgi:hypothetical protein
MQQRMKNPFNQFSQLALVNSRALRKKANACPYNREKLTEVPRNSPLVKSKAWTLATL